MLERMCKPAILLLILVAFLSNNYFVSAEEGDDTDTTTSCGFSEYVLDEATSTKLSIRSTETHMTVVMESTEKVWLGAGVSEDGLMVGSIGIMGSPLIGVNKYDMRTQELAGVRISGDQTLINTTFTQDDAGSRMEYTQLLVDGIQEVPSEGNVIFIWGIGYTNVLGIHSLWGSKEVSLKPCQQFIDSGEGAGSSGKLDKGTLLAHGIVGTVAFGALMPLGILSSSFRGYFDYEICSRKTWYLLHIILMTSSASLTIVTFALAIVAKNRSKGTHFKRAHEIVGLMLFIVVFIQILFAFFRPNKEPKYDEADSDEDYDEEKDKEGEKGEKRSTLRKIWEVGHKMMGFAIVLIGSYSIKSGLNLFDFFWGVNGETNVWVTLYWVWLAIVYCLMLLAIYRLFSGAIDA